MNHVIELGILDVVILRIWIDYVWSDGLIGLMFVIVMFIIWGLVQTRGSFVTFFYSQ